jgi:acetate kinase
MNATKVAATELVLVLNCGSSSIKFAVFDTGQMPVPRKPLWNGKVDGITGPSPTFGETGSELVPIALDPSAPYHTALEHINERVTAHLDRRRLAAVAHRVVHGGNKYFEPVLVDATVLADLKFYIPLVPPHQPFALYASNPDLPQIACFETAFHHIMPVGYWRWLKQVPVRSLNSRLQLRHQTHR